MRGGVPRTTVIVCRQMLLLPQPSVADHVRVAASVFVAVRLVTVLRTCSVAPLQASATTAGISQVHEDPVGKFRSAAHISVGGVVSRTVMVCVTFVRVSAGHSSPRFGGGVIVGGVKSRTVMVWRALALLPQPSVAVQVRVMTFEP